MDTHHQRQYVEGAKPNQHSAAIPSVTSTLFSTSSSADRPGKIPSGTRKLPKAGRALISRNQPDNQALTASDPSKVRQEPTSADHEHQNTTTGSDFAASLTAPRQKLTGDSSEIEHNAVWEEAKRAKAKQLLESFHGVVEKAKQARGERAASKQALVIELVTYKDALVGSGRDGRWGEFLKHVGLARRTADNWIINHKKMEQPNKLATCQLTPSENLRALLKTWKKKALPLLGSPGIKVEFLNLVVEEFQLTLPTAKIVP